MPYYVIGPDGQKYGPAEPQQLQAWAAEGRITQQTFIEDATSGDRVPAAALPYLTRPTPIGTVSPPPATPVFPPPMAAGAILPMAPAQAVLSVGPSKPNVRRRPRVAILRLSGAIVLMSLLISTLTSGHLGPKHTSSHNHFEVWNHAFPVIDVALAGLFVFWIAGRLAFGALHAWLGLE